MNSDFDLKIISGPKMFFHYAQHYTLLYCEQQAESAVKSLSLTE